MKKLSILLVPVSVLTTLWAQSVPGKVTKPLDPLHHGAVLFAETGCAHCHGTAGSGGDRGPDLKNIAHRMTAKAMATQIHDGGQSMPPFGDEFKDQDIADLVTYLRAKRKPLPPPMLKDSPPPS